MGEGCLGAGTRERHRQRVRDRPSKSERAYDRAGHDGRGLLKGTCVAFIGWWSCDLWLLALSH